MRAALRFAPLLALVTACVDGDAPPAPAATDETVASLRQLIPVDADDPQFGPSDAPVTIVLFVDFECAYSHDGYRRARGFVDRYPGDVRLVVKQRPLPGHLFARDAARAALAAHAVGHFGDMAATLFADRDHLQRPALLRRAATLGLDLPAFARALTSDPIERSIRDDLRLADELGVTGTPAWFVNGVFFKGRLDDQRADEIIASEHAYVMDLVADGTPRAEIYQRVTGGARGGRVTPPAPEVALDGAGRYRVPVEPGGLAVGARDGLVTVVLFGDLECPRTQRAWRTLARLRADDPDLRVVWRHDPLPQHPDALELAQLVEGAHALGRGVEVLDAVLAFDGAPTPALVRRLARMRGLDSARLRAAAGSAAVIERLRADRKLAAELAVRGTPTMFVNGTPLEGNLPQRHVAALIASERHRAQQLPAGAGAAYDRAQADARSVITTPRTRPSIPDLAPAMAVAIGDRDPQRGRPTAPVTIVTFLDFECPYSAEAATALDHLRAQHGDDLRLVFKHLPMAMHDHARNAAAAALAAQRQDRFWAMHDWLFAHQAQLDRASVERAAAELGLDLARFQRDFDDPAVTDQPILAAEAEARALGFTGTPTFVVNGQVVPGMIDEALLDELITGQLTAAQ